MTAQPSRPTLRTVLGSPLETQTYRNLAYLLLAIPLGLAYFVVLTTAVSLTLGMSVTLAGPILFLLTLLSFVAVASLDVRLTNALLDTDVAHPRFPEREDDAIDTVIGLVTSRDAWLGGLHLAWRSVFGFVAMFLLTVGLSLSVSLLVAPLVYGDLLVVEYQLGTWTIDTFGRSLVAAGVGFVVGVVTLVAGNLLATLAGVLTRATFERDADASTESPAA